METADHLFVHCRYTIRIWGLVKDWLGLYSIDTQLWQPLSLSSWWLLMTGPSSQNRKAVASITLLVSWEIWNERNARVFRHELAPVFVLLGKIKKEARNWVIAGAKGLSEIMPGE